MMEYDKNLAKTRAEVAASERKAAEELAKRAAADTERAAKVAKEASEKMHELMMGDMDYKIKKLKKQRDIEMAAMEEEAEQKSVKAKYKFEREIQQEQLRDKDNQIVQTNATEMMVRKQQLEVAGLTWELEQKKLAFKANLRKRQRTEDLEESHESE